MRFAAPPNWSLHPARCDVHLGEKQFSDTPWGSEEVMKSGGEYGGIFESESTGAKENRAFRTVFLYFYYRRSVYRQCQERSGDMDSHFDDFGIVGGMDGIFQ